MPIFHFQASFPYTSNVMLKCTATGEIIFFPAYTTSTQWREEKGNKTICVKKGLYNADW